MPAPSVVSPLTKPSQAIFAAVKAIPPGQTASYADIAAVALGHRTSARTVGWALAKCPPGVPWWRIIHADGTLPGVSDALQARLLATEGVILRPPRSSTA